MKEITIESDNILLSALYSKVDNPVGLVQIVHGMIEHKERYIEFINELNNAGYTVIIADNRGHGKSINDSYPLGHIETPDIMVNDQYMVTKYIKEDNEKLPFFMIGHSMGSLIARMYLKKHDDELDKLILSGTVGYTSGCKLGIKVGKRKSKKDKYGHSNLLYAFYNHMSFSNDVSWLSYNEDNVKRYMADPLCNFRFTNYACMNLFQMVSDLNNTSLYDVKNPNLPILSLSGKDDRTTLKTKGLVKTVKLLNNIGYKNVSFKEYNKMKHEILNEDDRKTVMSDMISFLKQ